MKKKCSALLLALVMCLGLLPAVAFAADNDFRIDKDGVLCEYTGPGGDVVIPDGVTGIGWRSGTKGAFSGCTNVTSITIPDSVTTIKMNAFHGCTGLTSLTIPGSVTEIGAYAFYGCTGLTSVTIGNGVTTIPMQAFYDCSSLTEVTIPASVTSIRSDAFRNTDLTDVYYGGSEAQWKAVSKGSWGTGILPSGIHYNSAGPCDVHSYSIETTPATCIAEGVETHTCTICGKTIQEVIAKTDDHTSGNAVGNGRGTHSTKCTVCGKAISTDDCTYDEGKVTRQPTATSEGEMTYTCTICGDTKVEAVPRLEDERCEEHTFDKGVVTKQPTVDAEGEMTYTCTVCGEAKTEIISRLDDPRKKFTDMEAGAFYLNGVAWAVNSGVTTGKTATTFAPNENCTHGQILTFLWRAAGEPESSATTPFAMNGGEYYYGAAKWAYEKGMIGADFEHGTSCTRADAVNYIWQAAGKGAASYDGRFTDIPVNSPYATAVAWAVANGVTTGATATTFNPGKICNRGEIVTFLYRYFGK